ncbi:MAG: hypothetical protein K9W43_03620 [Candidatus Thorarchaeota archaeon]|nr:hypothetical protein [Candidatus Thorarchaeota archaeon]
MKDAMRGMFRVGERTDIHEELKSNRQYSLKTKIEVLPKEDRIMELEYTSDVEFVMIRARTIGDWFRHLIAGGNNYSEHYLLESMARNYLASHATDWTGQKPQMIWSELGLITYQKKDWKKMFCDLIFQYNDDIWIIEVKDRVQPHEIFRNPKYQSAVDQLRKYKQRIKKLGWWPDHNIHLAVFWAFNESEIKEPIPIDVEKSLLWPKDRQ